VGSWVREEAMLALKDIIYILNQGEDALLIGIRAYIGADQP
jgi:hypothetical protein